MSAANILFLFMMFFGTIISLSSASWLIVWAGIEIGFLALIPLLFSGSKYLALNKEASLKYFCIQVLGSALLFVSGISLYLDLWTNLIWGVLFIFALSIKLGFFPGHFWVPSVVSGLEWFPAFLLLSWPKLAPLALLINFLEVSANSFQEFVFILGGASALVGGLIGNNQTGIRAMIGASSISHTGWVVMAAACGCLWTYFGIYCVTLSLTCFFCWEGNPFLSGLSILSLSGLPPFVMFWGKWAVIKGALENFISIKFLLLPILGTVISLVFYLKFLYSFYLNTLNSEFTSLNFSVLCLGFLNFTGMIYVILVFFDDRN